MVRFAVRLGAFICLITAFACSSDEGGSSGSGSGGMDGDASSMAGNPSAGSMMNAGGAMSAGGAGSVGAGGGGSTGAPDPACAKANARGFFPDCSLCGTDCDTINDGSGSYRACGCSSGCPCGLHCGSYQIAPGVVVNDICIR
jgi:hypothetical protein